MGLSVGATYIIILPLKTKACTLPVDDDDVGFVTILGAQKPVVLKYTDSNILLCHKNLL